MPLANNDVHVTAIRRTFVKSQTGDTVPGYEIHFTFRGQGDYTCGLPIQGYSAEKAMAAIKAVAEPLAETFDMFPGK